MEGQENLGTERGWRGQVEGPRQTEQGTDHNGTH